MDRTNAPGHVNHLFVAEDPATNRPPTELTAQDLNAHQEELINIILSGQLVPDAANNAQVLAALNAMFAKINGATGLIRTLTPAGGARVRELGDIANAATVGGIEFGISYNCNIDPATGVWAGRDVADICWLEKWSDAGGIKEFWYAQNAAAGAVPAWVKVFSLDMVNGVMSLGSAGTSPSHAVRLDQVPAPYRNRIINGDMQVSQMNVGNAVTPATGGYILDQWHFGGAVPASKLTFQQVADAPPGFKNSLKVTVAAQYAPAVGESLVLQQPIEGQNIADIGFGTANAKTVAVGVWVKSSVAGTYSCSLRNAASTRCYLGTITIANPNVWAYQVIVLVADTAGAWATDNTCGMWLAFDLGSGANSNGAAGAWGAAANFRTVNSVTFVNQAAGSTFNITGVQFEKVPTGSSVGTDYEFLPFYEQLRRCQRYYEKTYNQSTTPGTAIDIGHIHHDFGAASISLGIHCAFKATKRAAPTVTIYASGIANSPGTFSYGGGAAAAAVRFPDDYGFQMYQNAVSTAYVGFHYTANAQM